MWWREESPNSKREVLCFHFKLASLHFYWKLYVMISKKYRADPWLKERTSKFYYSACPFACPFVCTFVGKLNKCSHRKLLFLLRVDLPYSLESTFISLSEIVSNELTSTGNSIGTISAGNCLCAVWFVFNPLPDHRFFRPKFSHNFIVELFV